MMIRFLDLTLILLLAFMMQAELAIEREVGLPEQGSGARSGEVAYVMVTVSAAAVTATPRGPTLCDAGSDAELEQCLADPARAGADVVVVPRAGVSVQRLVEVLDVCVRAGVSCAAASLE